jgi:hypothetical protein
MVTPVATHARLCTIVHKDSRKTHAKRTFVSNMMTNLDISDMETCYKLFRREIIQSIDLKENRFSTAHASNYIPVHWGTKCSG